MKCLSCVVYLTQLAVGYIHHVSLFPESADHFLSSLDVYNSDRPCPARLWVQFFARRECGVWSEVSREGQQLVVS